MKRSEHTSGDASSRLNVQEDNPLSLLDMVTGFGAKCFETDVPQDSFDFGNNAPTIVLVPGFFSVAKDMTYIGEPMKEKMNVAYVPDLPHLGMADLMRSVVTVREKIKKVLQEEKNGDLNLLGHSLGGVLMLDVLGDKDFEAHRFIALSTPFKGAPFARWFPFFKSARQLAPESTYLTNLEGIHIDKTVVDVHVSLLDGEVPPEYQVPHSSISPDITIIKHPDFKHFDYMLGKKAKKFSKELSDRITGT